MGVVFGKSSKPGDPKATVTAGEADPRRPQAVQPSAHGNWRDVLNSVAEMDLWETDRREDRPEWKKYLNRAELLLQKPRTSLPKDLVDSALAGDFTSLADSSVARMKKKVIVFVSSTFTDTKAERNTLMKDVYPYLRTLCRILGLDFGSVDMRWGVNEETTLSHGTTAACVGEVQRCIQESSGPAFLAILGHKYGYQPLPPTIEEQEFNTLIRYLTSVNESTSLVESHYRLDENVIPPHFVLRSRSSDQKDWWQTSVKLQTQLRQAARACLSEHDSEKYFISVTEQEMSSGLFENPERESQVTVLRRTLKDVRDSQHRHRHIIDVISGEIDETSQEALKLLKEKKLEQAFNPDAILDFSYDETDKAQVKEYVRKSCDTICQSIAESILSNYETNLHVKTDDVFTEVVQHADIANEKCRTFVGREEYIQKVLEYVTNEATKLLVLHGGSGCGKTALMSICAKAINAKWRNAVTVLRFLGTTGPSGSARAVLYSLCCQIVRAYGQDVTQVPNAYKELVPYFREIMGYATKSKPLCIVLDSLDQLSNEDFGKNLKWLSLKEDLPPNIHIVVSTLPGECLTTLEAFLPSAHFLKVQAMSPEEGPVVLESMLSAHHRKLTAQQNVLVLEAFKKCPLPLYMRLCVDVASRWHSYDQISPDELAPDMPGLIETLFERLEAKFGKKLVHHALAYITVSKSGLSVAELEDILSCDDDVLDEVFSFWTPPFIRIPPLLWIRIRNELGAYLVEKGSDGTNTYGWYHRQFWETAQKRFVERSPNSNDGFQEKARKAIAEYFEGKWFVGKEYTYKKESGKGKTVENRKVASQPLVVTGNRNSGRTLNRRKLRELSYQLVKLSDWKTFKNLVSELEFIECKFEAQQGYECVAEFTEAAKVSNDPTIKALAKFIGANLSHILHEPDSVFQLASQQVTANQVRKMFLSFEEQRLPRKTIKDQNPTEVEDPCQMTLRGHTSGVRSCCYSPNGDLIASCAEDGTLRIWDSFSGAELTTVTGLPGPTYPELADPYHGERPCCFSLDGRHVATGSEDGWLQIWDLSGAEVFKVRAHGGALTGIVYLRGNGQIATCSKDETCKLWSTASGELEEIATVHMCMYRMQGLGLDVSPDGAKIAVGCYGGLVIIDTASHSVLTAEEGLTNINLGATFSPSGKEVATGGDNSAVTLWDAETGHPKGLLRGHSGWVWCVKYTPDGSRLITCSSDRSIKLWDTSSQTCLASLGGHLHRISWASVKPGSADAFVSGSLDFCLKIWDLDAVSKGRVPPVGGLHFIQMKISPDQKYVASCKGWATACTINSTDDDTQLGTTTSHQGFLADASFSEDATFLITVDTGHRGDYRKDAVQEASAIVSTMPDGQNLHKLPSVAPCCVACNAKHIFIGTAECKVDVFLSQSGFRELFSWNFWDKGSKVKSDEPYVKSISANVKGHVATVVCSLVKIWDSSTTTTDLPLLAELPNNEVDVTICKYSPDGTVLVTSDVRGLVSVWDSETNYSLSRTLVGHTSMLRDLAFSPSGRYLATVGVEMSLRVWDASEEFKMLGVWYGPVNRMGFLKENVLVLGEATGVKRSIQF